MRKHIKKIGYTVLFACVLMLSACSAEGNLFSISDFKANGEFSFIKIPWNTTINEVELLLSDELEVDSAREPFPQGCILCRSKRMYNLDGKDCRPTFEFQNGGLKMVQFEFLVEVQEDDWVEKQLEKIVALYGPESEKIERENSDLQLKTRALKWETGQTMLQFIVLSNSSGETRVIIALVKK